VIVDPLEDYGHRGPPIHWLLGALVGLLLLVLVIVGLLVGWGVSL